MRESAGHTHRIKIQYRPNLLQSHKLISCTSKVGLGREEISDGSDVPVVSYCAELLISDGSPKPDCQLHRRVKSLVQTDINSIRGENGKVVCSLMQFRADLDSPP